MWLRTRAARQAGAGWLVWLRTLAVMPSHYPRPAAAGTVRLVLPGPVLAQVRGQVPALVGVARVVPATAGTATPGGAGLAPGLCAVRGASPAVRLVVEWAAT